MKKTFFILILLTCLLQSHAQRTFIHPGITYTQADLDRMKAMVNARQEPFYSTYQALLTSSYSQIGNGNYSDITQIKEGEFNGKIGGDGRRAHDLALLYHITGNKAYADDAVKRLNRYKNLTNASCRGTAPLDNGKIYMLIEAAELMRDYEGWDPADQQAFKNMLTHPFYSTKTSAESHKSLTDNLNNVSFYWNIYQFDPGRFGNQGLFAARGLMAMGIYLDNDTIYDRAYRYLEGLPARTDDLPYKPGPPTQGNMISENNYMRDFSASWPSGSSRENQYHSDEALHYYIYQNGQNQESSRDQGHVMAGIGNYTAIAEIAWSQGDTLYNRLDNRILTGVEYNIRYNLSYVKSYPDQTSPWEPSGYSKNEADCTYENGKYYQAVSRSKRWESKAISPDGRGGAVTGPGGWKTQVLEHYKTRMGLPAEETKWLQRSYDYMMEQYGIENWGVAPNWFYEWTGWGTLTKQRTEWMTGDPGSWKGGKRVSHMPKAPCTINAVDYDYFSGNGEGHTYHNKGTVKSTLYRTDGTVEIGADGDEFAVTAMEVDEWLSYSLIFPAPDGNTTPGTNAAYNIYINYKASESGAKLFAAVDNGKKKGKELSPAGEWTERCLGTFDVRCGAGVIRIYVKGKSNVVQLKNIRVEPLETKELATINMNEKALSVKVYDANNNDVTASYKGSVTGATDKNYDTAINLGHQKFLVYDFGEDGLDIANATVYNNGITMDTREQAFVSGSTEDGKYTSPWDRNSRKDILRTNNTIYGNCPIMNNAWISQDGESGSYQVGPLGKYRYFGVYNWSAACNISEVEIQSVITNSSAEADTEPSAEWEAGVGIQFPTLVNKENIISVNGNRVTAAGAKQIDAYTLLGTKYSTVQGETITMPKGIYLLSIVTEKGRENHRIVIR